jgi:hypothetical protein
MIRSIFKTHIIKRTNQLWASWRYMKVIFEMKESMMFHRSDLDVIKLFPISAS